MKQIKTEQKNGTAAANKMPDVKAKPVKPAPHNAKKETVVKPSLEERILKADELKSLTVKRAKTNETLHHIRAFSFNSDDSCTLTLEDSSRQMFETSNSNLINLLREHLIDLLTNKVAELDKQILAFNL